MARQAGNTEPATGAETEKFRTTPITATITRVKSLPKSAIIYRCAASQYWQFRVFLEGKQRKRSTTVSQRIAKLKMLKLSRLLTSAILTVHVSELAASAILSGSCGSPVTQRRVDTTARKVTTYAIGIKSFTGE